MTINVLIEANEGNTDTVIICEGYVDELKQAVHDKYQASVLAWPWDHNRDEQTSYLKSEETALIAMIDAHTEWREGRYVLENVEPHWQQWTLVVMHTSPYLYFDKE